MRLCRQSGRVGRLYCKQNDWSLSLDCLNRRAAMGFRVLTEAVWAQGYRKE